MRHTALTAFPQCSHSGRTLRKETVWHQSGTKVCTAETPQAEERNLIIKIIMIRVEAEDYDAWLKTHYDHVEDRHSYGMTDGPVYRDIDNPNAALFHIHVESLDRAMQWFRTDTFKEATKQATVRWVGTSTWPRSSNLALRPSTTSRARWNYQERALHLDHDQGAIGRR